jgi:hypothetical protein
MVARLDGGHRTPDPLHDSGSLVSKDCGQRRGIDLVTDDGVRVAHAGGRHLYEYLVRTEIVQLKLFNRQGLPWLPGHSCSYLHGHFILYGCVGLLL